MVSCSQVACIVQRAYDARYYLVLLVTGLSVGHFGDIGENTRCPMARAVVDDFGDLVMVRGWL